MDITLQTLALHPGAIAHETSSGVGSGGMEDLSVSHSKEQRLTPPPCRQAKREKMVKKKFRLYSNDFGLI